MEAKQLSELLKQLDACQEAREWSAGMTLEEAWENCKRADHMLWLCEKMLGKPGWPDRKEIVLAACACAETALKYVPSGQIIPSTTIETARRWARGEATIEEFRTAADAAYAAAYDAPSDAAYDAARAAAAAAGAYAGTAAAAYAGAAAYAAADVAAAYASFAAGAAASAVTDAAAAAVFARAKAFAEMADIVRAMLKIRDLYT